MKKGFIIAAAVCAALGLALFAYAFVASGFDFTKLGTAKYETNTYPVGEDFAGIEINTAETEILFKPSADGTCSVVCREQERLRHTVSVENGTLRITTEDRREWYDRVNFFSGAPSMTVYLPSDVYQALKIDSRTGGVSVPDIFSFSSIAITATTGDVLCSASASGPVTVKTGTGDIRLCGVRAESIGLQVSTGSICAESLLCEGTVSAEVSTGKTELTDVICQNLDSRGSTGDLVLKNVAASGSFRLERRTGDVRFENCDAGSITVQTSTGNVTGTLRTAKVFLAKTSTGTARVPDTVSGGRCEITTSSGNIDICLSAD